MAIEKTLIVVKPEAFDIRNTIKEYIIKNTKFKIVSSKVFKLNESDVECIYVDDLSTDLLLSIKKHLIGKIVEVCVIEGESAIEIMWNLVGKNFDGNKCETNTLRYIFGRIGKIEYYKGMAYYLNAVHKTTNSEVELVLKWYDKKRLTSD